ncbi:hypothetical protein NL676_022735 [Syzygium grande]|nr:hypothetical protein NL676_022735 [Syzygium grande]
MQAYAAVKFADACLRELRGDTGVLECAFVASQVTELPFFASKVHLGRTGAEVGLLLGLLNEYESVASSCTATAQCRYKQMIQRVPNKLKLVFVTRLEVQETRVQLFVALCR